MKIVQPRIKPITQIDGEDALLTIQRIAKTCYKTNKDTDDMGSAVRVAKICWPVDTTACLNFIPSQ